MTGVLAVAVLTAAAAGALGGWAVTEWSWRRRVRREARRRFRRDR